MACIIRFVSSTPFHYSNSCNDVFVYLITFVFFNLCLLFGGVALAMTARNLCVFAATSLRAPLSLDLCTQLVKGLVDTTSAGDW